MYCGAATFWKTSKLSRCRGEAVLCSNLCELELGRVAVEPPTFPLLECLLRGGRCHCPRGRHDRTKLRKGLARWLELLGGELFHCFYV